MDYCWAFVNLDCLKKSIERRGDLLVEDPKGAIILEADFIPFAYEVEDMPLDLLIWLIAEDDSCYPATDNEAAEGELNLFREALL